MNYRNVIVVLALSIIGYAPLVGNAQVLKHKVTPRVIDLTVEARDIITKTLVVENFGGSKISVYPSVNEISVSTGGDIVDFVPQSMSDNTNSVTSWLEISRGALELLPGEIKEIDLTIKINSKVEAGEYHAFIGFGSARNRDIAEQQVREGRAPGVIVTLTIEEDNRQVMKLSKFSVDRFVTQIENKAIHYVLENPGGVPVTPTGEIILTDTWGNEVGAIEVNPNADVLIPGQLTKYTTPVPIDGMTGKYKAFLSINYGTTHIASVNDTAFFYVIPWQKLLIVFIVVLLLASIITILLHKKFNRQEKVDAEYVALHIHDGISDDKDHDINLKKQP